MLATDLGNEQYRKRGQTIEPVFGHTKHNRKFTKFHQRGRAAVRTEWRLLMMTHNLTKLHSPPDRQPRGLKRPHPPLAGYWTSPGTNALHTTVVELLTPRPLRDGLIEKEQRLATRPGRRIGANPAPNRWLPLRPLADQEEKVCSRLRRSVLWPVPWNQH